MSEPYFDISKSDCGIRFPVISTIINETNIDFIKPYDFN